MKTTIHAVVTAAMAVALVHEAAVAQSGARNVKLHINPRWSECAIQFDPSLTQEGFRRFTQEAGLVAYFRPLNDARPMGTGNYEVSILQWGTALDDTDPAWNDTFVHPDSTHWLFEGDRLAFPGLTMRAGVTDNVDVGLYLTKNIMSNYGFYGAQVQYALVNGAEQDLAASIRGSFVSSFGPEDVSMTVYGLDLVGSKRYAVYSNIAAVTPYVGISAYLSRASETSSRVDLKKESIGGIQAMAGAVASVSIARISFEYNVARVNTLSFKMGVAF